jgi:hypothetical protein
MSSYPKDENKILHQNIEDIKNSDMPNNQKWEKKYILIKKFIEKNHCLPILWNIYLVCNHAGNVYIKTEIIKKEREDKISLLIKCNFIKENGSLCNKQTAAWFEYKKDPFKCSQHLKRCINCIDWIDSHGSNKKYDNYCARCFKRLFPDDERSLVIYEHSKEILVRNAISKKALENEKFKNFIHDKPLYTNGCNCTHKRRIDHRKLIGNTMLAIETDEYAHRGYDKKDEEIRYDDLYMLHSGKWIFIRFNPDNTKDNKNDINEKIKILLIEIENQIINIENEKNKNPVEIIYLFY